MGDNKKSNWFYKVQSTNLRQNNSGHNKPSEKRNILLSGWKKLHQKTEIQINLTNVRQRLRARPQYEAGIFPLESRLQESLWMIGKRRIFRKPKAKGMICFNTSNKVHRSQISQHWQFREFVQYDFWTNLSKSKSKGYPTLNCKHDAFDECRIPGAFGKDRVRMKMGNSQCYKFQKQISRILKRKVESMTDSE